MRLKETSAIVLAVFGWLTLTALAQATIIVDDHFDDGVITTDGGPGTGFYVPSVASYTATESGSNAVLNGFAGYGHNAIVSDQSIDPIDADGAIATFVIASFSNFYPLQQVSLSLRDTAATNALGNSTVNYGGPVGFYVTFNASSGSWFVKASYTQSGDNMDTLYQSLATIADPAWNGTTPLTVEMKLTATDWTVDFTGTGAPATQTGLWSALTPGSGGGYNLSAVSSAAAGVYIQGDNGDGGSAGTDLRVDRIILNDEFVAIPEPSSFAMLAFGALVMGFIRRRRSR